jgi:NhaC family Na+:H+ antiporter
VDSVHLTPQSALHREPSFVQSLLTIVGSALLICIGYGVFKIKVEVLLLVACGVVGITARLLGLGWKQMQAGIILSISKGMPAMLIVIVVGALSGSWLISGTIPMLTYLGLGLISQKLFLLTACLCASLVSVLLGSGYATIATVGVAFMGIAHGLNIPMGQAAGALVSGAYLGDKISPFAGNANFAVSIAGVNIYDHIRHCLWTTLPALCVALGVYYFLGSSGGNSGVLSETEVLRKALATHFVFSPLLLLPVVVSVWLAAGNRPVLPGMFLSIAVSVVLAVFIQHQSLTSVLNALVEGPEIHTGNKLLDKLLEQGGMTRMMHVTLIAILAFAFNGILQSSRLLEPLVTSLFKFTTTPLKAVGSTAFTCFVVELMTGAAYVTILLPAELFKPVYRNLGLAGKNLTRAIGDSGIVVVPLIPWSIAGAFMSGTLGVSVLDYAPWAVFCYMGVIFTFIAAASGFSMAKVKNEDETQPGS